MIAATSLSHPAIQSKYSGKVRDVYTLEGGLLAIVATDRISAFDYILPAPIPEKGAILNTIAARFLQMTGDIVPNWLLDAPHPRLSVGYKCEPFKIEMVVRGYLCGHALRTYQKGDRTLCGVTLPEGLRSYEAFPKPILTPSTKADEGHDEDISREEILRRGLATEEQYAELERITLALYERGATYARARGLLLADTKYEFGLKDGQIYLIDEIHTPDSSRYFYQEGFDDCVAKGETPKQLSKEFVREWLMSEGFQGREGERIPAMTPEVVARIRARYGELYERIMGTPFHMDEADTEEAISDALRNSLARYSGK